MMKNPLPSASGTRGLLLTILLFLSIYISTSAQTNPPTPKTPALEIIRATWRVANQPDVDVTSTVAAMVKDGKLQLSLTAAALSLPSPPRGVVGNLDISYRVNGGNPLSKTIRGGGTAVNIDASAIMAQTAASSPATLPSPESTLTIVKATYGSEGKQIDITENIRTLVKKDRLELTVAAPDVKDLPPTDAVDYLDISYKLNGKSGTLRAKKGATLVIAPGTKLDYTQSDLYVDTLEFYRDLFAGHYKSQGPVSAKWDAAATQTLDTLAIYLSQLSILKTVNLDLFPTPYITPGILGDAAQKAIDLGCEDPMVLYARALSFINAKQSADAGKWLEKAIEKIPGTNYPPFARFKLYFSQYSLLFGTPKATPAWDESWKLIGEMARPPFFNSAARREIGDTISQVFYGFKHDRYESTITTISNWEGFDPWIASNVAASLHKYLAWDARGTGLANEVTEAGLLGFQKHLALARTAAESAYKLHPELPEPAVTMIGIAMGEGKDNEIDLWFERATDAQMDLAGAYSTAFYAHSPRWGGSNRLVLGITKSAVESNRFDTALPWQYLVGALAVVKDELGGDPNLFATPLVHDTAVRILNGYLSQYKDTVRARFFLRYLAAINIASGDLMAARRAFDQLAPEMNHKAFQDFGIVLPRIVDTVYLTTNPDQVSRLHYDQAIAAGDYQSAQTALDAMLAAEAPAGRSHDLLAKIQSSAKQMQALSENRLLSLTQSTFSDFWIAYSPYNIEKDILVSRDTELKIESRLPLPDRNYELHAKFEIPKPPLPVNQFFRIIWGHQQAGEGWNLFVETTPPRVCIVPPFMAPEFIPVELMAENSLDILYINGMASAKFNGKVLPYVLPDPNALQQMNATKSNFLGILASPTVNITAFTLQHLSPKGEAK